MNTEDRDLIDKFSREKLGKKDLEKVDEKIKTDPEFAKELGFQLATNQVLRDMKRADRRQQLKEQLAKDRRRRWIIILVSILVLLASILIYIVSTPVSPELEEREGLLQAFVEKEIPDLRSAGVENWSDLIINGNYSRAIQVMQNNIQEAGGECALEDQQYYLGVLLLLHSDDPQTAIPHLECAEASIDLNEEDAPLYLAIAYLLTDDRVKAFELIEENPEIEDQLPESLQELLRNPE